MTPTAVSQIIEALCKLVVGLGLAYWLVKAGADQSHAAAGAITGVTVGTIVALAYMLLNYITVSYTHLSAFSKLVMMMPVKVAESISSRSHGMRAFQVSSTPVFR